MFAESIIKRDWPTKEGNTKKKEEKNVLRYMLYTENEMFKVDWHLSYEDEKHSDSINCKCYIIDFIIRWETLLPLLS